MLEASCELANIVLLHLVHVIFTVAGIFICLCAIKSSATLKSDDTAWVVRDEVGKIVYYESTSTLCLKYWLHRGKVLAYRHHKPLSIACLKCHARLIAQV